MPGFFFTNLSPVSPSDPAEGYLRETLTADGYSVWRSTRMQFLQDKLFAATSQRIFVLEGVILNKNDLLRQYNTPDFLVAVEQMAEESPTFFSGFRGMFSGAVYEFATKTWTVFTDHIGNKSVFWYANDGHVIVSSMLKDLTAAMKQNGIPRITNDNGLRQFLNFGGFPDESTYVDGVRRLFPGDYLVIRDGAAEVKNYHTFTRRIDPDLSDEEAIERLDAAFRKAMSRAMEKNRDYGYTGILDLSGGADSRMIAYTAHSLGLEGHIMCHYSQSNSTEAIVAKRIAKSLGAEFHSFPLDDAKFLLDAEKLVHMNSGAGYYCGITGGERMLRELSDRPLGIEFTGLLGDVYEGGMLTTDGNIPPTYAGARFQICRAADYDGLQISSLSRFEDNELFWFHIRGMLIGMHTFLIRQHYVEPFTAFGDVDFLNVWLSVPWEHRVKSRIGLRWLQTKYPKAMKYTYAGTQMPLSFEFKPVLARISGAVNWRLNRLHRYFGQAGKNEMNPFAYWEQHYPWLRDWITDMYQRNMQVIRESGVLNEYLLSQVEAVFHGPGTLSKYLALTALIALRQQLVD